MKIAFSIFKENVSPRLDIADSLWLYQIDENTHTASLIEKSIATYDQPTQLIGWLKEKNVTSVICGGCPHFFLRMLLFHGIEVAPCITGDPSIVALQIAQGAFQNPILNPNIAGWRGHNCFHCCNGHKHCNSTHSTRKNNNSNKNSEISTK